MSFGSKTTLWTTSLQLLVRVDKCVICSGYYLVPKLLFTPVCVQRGPLGHNQFKYVPAGSLVQNLHHTCLHLR